MGVTAYTEEFTSSVAAARLFKAIFTDVKSTIPKIMPQYIKSVEIEAGAGGVDGGCINKTTYTQGSPMRHRINSFDSKNLTCNYTLIEGGKLNDKLESVSCSVRFEPLGH